MTGRRVLDNLSGSPKVIDREAIIMGGLRGDNSYLVHGEVHGDSDVAGVMMLGKDCSWQGNITAEVVIVKGTVVGNISAHNKIELRNTARVQGNLSAPVVAIAKGANHIGEVHEDSMLTHFVERRAH